MEYTECMTTKPCACGCGTLVTGTYSHGHNRRKPPVEPNLCACGCGEFAPVDQVRRIAREYVRGHRRHSEETKRQISQTKREATGRSLEPLQPRLCGCGCGGQTTVYESRNRVSNYLPGHLSKANHPMAGKEHTPETRARLAQYTGPQASSYNSWNAMRSRCRDRSNGSSWQNARRADPGGWIKIKRRARQA